MLANCSCKLFATAFRKIWTCSCGEGWVYVGMHVWAMKIPTKKSWIHNYTSCLEIYLCHYGNTASEETCKNNTPPSLVFRKRHLSHWFIYSENLLRYLNTALMFVWNHSSFVFIVKLMMHVNSSCFNFIVKPRNSLTLQQSIQSLSITQPIKSNCSAFSASSRSISYSYSFRNVTF